MTTRSSRDIVTMGAIESMVLTSVSRMSLVDGSGWATGKWFVPLAVVAQRKRQPCV